MYPSPRCSVFLLDQHTGELVAKVFDGGLPDKQKTISIKVGQGIAGYVAETGAVQVCLALKSLDRHHRVYMLVSTYLCFVFHAFLKL